MEATMYIVTFKSTCKTNLKPYGGSFCYKADVDPGSYFSDKTIAEQACVRLNTIIKPLFEVNEVTQ